VGRERCRPRPARVVSRNDREILDDLLATLRALERNALPFADNLPARDAEGTHWLTPEPVGECLHRVSLPRYSIRSRAPGITHAGVRTLAVGNPRALEEEGQNVDPGRPGPLRGIP
jgi:hypothetical protein